MHYSLYKFSRAWGVNTFAILLCLLLFPYQCDSYTEVFAVTKDSNDNTYFVGNRDSDFFIVKKNSFCSLQWESTAGSTSGDDNDDGNSEVLHDSVIGQDGAVYAVGSTHGSFASPSNEVPNLDAAVMVYDSSSGAIIRQKQYDIAADLDNVAQAISQKGNGNLLVAVYGSVPNIESTATYETRILEIDSETLEVQKVYEIVVTTTENVFSITGGPKLLDFIYEESTNSIIALGHILGRGLLWRYSFDSETASNQVEWGEAFGNFQVSGFTSDGNGAYYVVGSSSERVLGNDDLQTTVSAEYHAYVVRFDNLDSSNVSPTWIRQLAGSGSSQSGSDIDIDPVTGEIVVIGEFDADFSVTDVQTSQTFSLNLSTDDGITDVFLWYLDASTGDFKELRSSSVASTNSEDRGNAISILSRRTVQIGGITNDGDDAASTACDRANTLPSPTPSPTPTPSVTPSPTPSTSSSPSSSSSPSQTVSPSMSSSKSGIPSATSSPSPSGSFLFSGSSSMPSSTPFSSVIGTIEANTSPSPLTSQVFPSSSPSPIILQVSESKRPSPSITPNPSETTKPSLAVQISQSASLDISESTADPTTAAGLASVSRSAESSPVSISHESLSVTLEETAESQFFFVSDGPATENELEAIASAAPTEVISDQDDSMTSSNEATLLVMAAETEDIGTVDDITEEFEVSGSQEAPTNDELVIDIEKTPSGDERDIPASESPQASSNAILVSFVSETPSFSSSQLPSPSAMILQTAIFSPNLEMNDVSSVSASSFDFSPQSIPQFIPSTSLTFVSVDLGTPTPSSSPSIFSNFPLSSPREAPSTTFDFILVDLSVSSDPSQSSMETAVDVNFISPTPSLSKTALIDSLGTITPDLSAEPSSTIKSTGKVESSFTLESSLETPTESSGLQTFISDQTPAPEKTFTTNDDDLFAKISITPTEEFQFFPSDVGVRSIEALPTAFDDPIEPSPTPQSMFTMPQTNGEEQETMKSGLPSADSIFDEAAISPLQMQVGEAAVMSPPESSIVVTPLVSEIADLRVASSSPKIQDIESSGEAEFISDTLRTPLATPDDTDDILPSMTELSQLEMIPSMTALYASTEPFSSQPETMIIFEGDDDSLDEKDMMSSALPTLESRVEVKESPIFTKTESIGPTSTQEFTFIVIPVLPESQSALVMESPFNFEPTRETGLSVLETFQVAAETSLFLDIPSSPQGKSTPMDFLESPEPSRAFAEILLPSDNSNPFDDDSSLVIISPDAKNPQEIQSSESAPEPSNLIFSESITPIVSPQDTKGIGDTEIASTQSNFREQAISSAEVSFPFESMEGFVGSTNPGETLKPSTEEEEEDENLQASVEGGQQTRDLSPSATFLDVQSDDDEDTLENRPEQSIAPYVTSFADPISSFSPSVFATELAGSSQTPVPSSPSTEETGLENVLESDPPRGSFAFATTSETVPVPSKHIEDDFESPTFPFLSASSEFPSTQELADTGFSPTSSSEDFQFTGDAKPDASFDFEHQMDSSTPEFSTQVTAVAIISSSLEQATEIASPSRTKAPVNSFLAVPSQSQVPEPQQGEPVNALVVSETPIFSSEQSLSASMDASSEFTPQGTTENVPFASAEAQIQIPETPGAGESERGIFSQGPDEHIRAEHSVTPDQIPVSTSQITTPTPTSESLTKATEDASRTPEMADFTPGLIASIFVDSPKTEDPKSSGGATPPAAESSLVSASASITLTPEPSESKAVEIPTPTTTAQAIPKEPVFSFIDIVFPSATPSSSPTIRTGTITASPTADVDSVSISPIVSPVSSQGRISVSPSVATGSRSPPPSASPNPSDAVLIVLPSATPSSSLAVLIVLPSATPSSSLPVTVSSTVKPSLTAIESQPGESSPPVSTVTFSPTLVGNPDKSNLLQPPFASQSATPKASPSSADRGFLTIAPSSQGLGTPAISETPRPAESTNFSQAPASSAVPSLSATEVSPAPSAGSPAISPSRSSQASLIGTEEPSPSFSNQPLTQETPTQMVPVFIQPSSTTTPPQNLSSSSPMGSPTQETLESVQPSSLGSPVFKPSISSLPSFVGSTTETPSVSSQPLAQGTSISPSPSISGNMMGFASQTFLMEPSVFQGVDFSILPSAEGNSEEPTASLLPTQRMELETFSFEPASKTEEPAVAEGILVQSPATSHETDDMEEETSVTPLINPSFSEEVEVSTVPSSVPSPSSVLTASAQPTASSSVEPSPKTTVSVRPSPSAISGCVGDGSIIVDPDSLNRTSNFQRVNMVIQVAGPNLTGACQFTGVIAERFILLSAINTLSQADMWHITSIENGPPVLEEESALVGIEDEDSFQVDTTVVSPSPSTNITRRIRFEGSVIFNITAFMDSLSVELASGSYVEYINSQNIVKVMTAEGFNDIKWTGMISAPRVIDVQVQEEDTRVGSGGLTSGEISAVALGMLLIVGVAAFVIVEGGVSTRRSGAILPI